MKRRLSVLIQALILFLVAVQPIMANPYFYIDGPTSIYPGYPFEFTLFLDTDGSTLTLAQASVAFDNAVIDSDSITNLSSACSFWGPPDPALGLGNASTPYFTENTLVVSCGFSGQSYASSDAGDQILKFNLRTDPAITQSYQTTLTIGDVKFLYKDAEVSAGSSQNFNLKVFDATISAFTSPTPTPAPVTTDTLTEGELQFVDIASGSSSTTTQSLTGTGSDQDLALNRVADQDDSIPPPPANLEPRTPVTPFPVPPTPDPETTGGDVLSVQSLRELLIPGKSEADQRVVLINFITTLTFLVILAILVWRLITLSKMNKLRFQHMKDSLTGELSVLQSKIDEDTPSEKEFSESLERLQEGLNE